jgi:hypothetical protein
LYWPSFNGAAATGGEQHRAVINTYLSLVACTIITFAISSIVDKDGKIEMVSAFILLLLLTYDWTKGHVRHTGT